MRPHIINCEIKGLSECRFFRIVDKLSVRKCQGKWTLCSKLNTVYLKTSTYKFLSVLHNPTLLTTALLLRILALNLIVSVRFNIKQTQWFPVVKKVAHESLRNTALSKYIILLWCKRFLFIQKVQYIIFQTHFLF